MSQCGDNNELALQHGGFLNHVIASCKRPNNKENRYEVLYMQNYHEMWQHISFQLKQLELYRHHKKREESGDLRSRNTTPVHETL